MSVVTVWQPYPEYYDSRIEWIGAIPEHWGVIRLKNAVILKNNRVNEWSNDDNFIGLENIESWTGRLIYSDRSFALENDDENSKSVAGVFQVGDLLFGKLRPYLAKAFLATSDGVCTSELLVMKPLQATNGRFLLYTVLSTGFIELVNSSTFGVKMPRANWDMIGNIPVPFPSRPEQDAIVDFLDRETARIDKLITKNQRLLDLLTERRQALITNAVTQGLDTDVSMKPSGVEWLHKIPKHWNLIKVKFLADKIGSGKTPRGGAEVYVESGVLFIRSQNVHFDGLRLDDVVYIDSQIDAEMASTRVQPHDVLLNITGASIGRCTYVPQNFVEANVNQHVCIIRPRQKLINTRFLHAVFSSDIIQQQIFANETGVSREGLNFEQIGNLWLGLPPNVAEQIEIMSYLDEQITKLDRLYKKIQAIVERLRERRTALISEAVTGKIKVSE